MRNPFATHNRPCMRIAYAEGGVVTYRGPTFWEKVRYFVRHLEWPR